jgi:conjugative relaxase-like TrwC/TraI family protein
MLQVDWMKGGGTEAANYFTSPDYFLENDVKAFWQGKYAASLGFKGEVTYKDLKLGLNNRTPDGKKLTQRDDPDRRCCAHLMFSVPKSVSIIASIAGDNRAIEAVDKAVDLAMQEIQKVAQRRVRKGGDKPPEVTSNFIYATFAHSLGRPVDGTPDPQIHRHVVVLNATKSSDGKWYALDGEAIKANAPYFQAFFRLELAKQIMALGYKLDIENGDFEIHGITKEMRDKFSMRTKQVNDTKDKFGYTNPESIANIAKMTREKKNDNHTWEQLQQIWADRLTRSELSQIRDTYVSSLGYGVRDTPDFSAKYIDKALKELTHKDTWITERKLLTAAMKEGLGKVSMEGMESHITDLHRRGQILRKKNKLTSEEAYEKQWRVMDMWKAGMGKHEKLGRDTYTVKDPPHIRALKKLMGSRDRFMSVRANIKLNDAVKTAQGNLNAAPLKDINNPPPEEVWFITGKVPDGDLPDIMEKAIELEKRVVFWGELQRSDMEEQLRLKPIELFDRPEPKTTLSKRLEQFILTMIQRGRDVFEERREPERYTSPERGG